jgi:branched-chain amino acid transport system substrate-binding protein
MGVAGVNNVYASMAYDMGIVLALAMQKAGAAADNAAISAAVLEIAGPAGQKVTSFAEGKMALKASQKINYEGASGPLDFDANGDAISVFGVNKFHNGTLERLYLLK